MSIRTYLTAPTAVIGSIALALSAAPAAAAEPRTEDAARLLSEPLAQTVAQRAAAQVAHAAASHAAHAVGVALATKAPATHTVRRGDTVSAIAAKHGLRTADVLAWNGLGWKSIIHPGDVLRLSATSAASAPAKPAKPAASKPSASKPATKPSSAYTVKKGDTLWAIAHRNGVSVAALQSANRLQGSSIIYPGQKLTVPGVGAKPAAPAAKPAPAKPAPAKPAKPAPAKPASPAASSTHTVAAGDTLWAIATREKVTLARLLAANGLTGSSIIYPGQKLVIPGDDWVAPAPASGDAAPQLYATLDAEQKANAKTIIAVGRELGVPDRGIAIALATAMVESRIRNVDHGTYDSLGVFQQRPSTGWGTPEQVQDVRRSAAVFFGGPNDPNGTTTRGLLDIRGWQDRAFGDAAQAVQVSAYPDRYGQWEIQAFDWLRALG